MAVEDELADVIPLPRSRCEERGHLPSTHPALWGRSGTSRCGVCDRLIRVEVTEVDGAQ